MVVKGHRPQLALLVEIDEIFSHCAKAFMRSQLWEPQRPGSRTPCRRARGSPSTPERPESRWPTWNATTARPTPTVFTGPEFRRIPAPPRFGLDRQVDACLYSGGGRRLQGARRPDPARDPRRAGRARRPDPLRALRPADHEAPGSARPARRSPSTWSSSRTPGWSGPARGPLQVPPPRHRAAAATSPSDGSNAEPRRNDEDHPDQRVRRRPGQGPGASTPTCSAS